MKCSCVARRRPRRADPRRVRHPRYRGEDRGHPVRAVQGFACVGVVSWPAVHRHRGGPLGRLGAGHSAEFVATPDPATATMADQEEIVAGEADLGGTMRLDPIRVVLEPGSIVAQAYESTQASERHRHRYEVNNAYRDRIAESGLDFRHVSRRPPGGVRRSAGDASVRRRHPGASRVEEPADPLRHPLFVGFVGAAIDYKAGERLPVEIPEQPSNGSEQHDRVDASLSEPEPVVLVAHTSSTISSVTLHTGKDFRPAQGQCPDARREDRDAGDRRALRRGRYRRDGRRRPHSDGLPVSPSLRFTPACGSCLPDCSTSTAKPRT